MGLALFAAGGVGDLLWHTIFGIEATVDGAFSPSHVSLMAASLLVVGGPLRHAWRQPWVRLGWSRALPLFISTELLLSMFSLILQILHPFVQVWPGAGYAPATPEATPGASTSLMIAGVGGTVAHTLLLVGLMLFLIRRWGAGLPVGFFTLLVALNHLAIATQRAEYRLVPAGILAGLLADLLYHKLKPALSRTLGVRVMAAAVPAALYAAYALILVLTDAVWWTFHGLTGLITTAGSVGLLVSYLAFPPAAPPGAPESEPT